MPGVLQDRITRSTRPGYGQSGQDEETEGEEQTVIVKAGLTIKTFRKLKGIKQKDLAAKLYMSQAHLSLMECGHVNVSVETMDEILHALGYKLAVMEIREKKYELVE